MLSRNLLIVTDTVLFTVSSVGGNVLKATNMSKWVLILNLLILLSWAQVCSSTCRSRKNIFMRYKRETTDEEENQPCNARVCYPHEKNLLIGRDSPDKLYASSTCGYTREENFLIPSIDNAISERDNRLYCNATIRKENHDIDKLLQLYDQTTAQLSWWQSRIGEEDVYIQINLENEFLLTGLKIEFRTFSPDAMIIQRSSDFGGTWKDYRYYAANCKESFYAIPEKKTKHFTEVVCDSNRRNDTVGDYLQFEPLDEQVTEPCTDEAMEHVKITNLRIRFTKFSQRAKDLATATCQKEVSYYAITHMQVFGTCYCNGNANDCLPLREDLPDSISSTCQCLNNTAGPTCDRCEDLFNDQPWKPATKCKACNCNGHAESCYFDQKKYEESGGRSGGICRCLHNTVGENCDRCGRFYYRDQSREFSDEYVCQRCNCHLGGHVGDGSCDSETGQCPCKQNVQGRNCNTCKPGYFNLTHINPYGCDNCNCDYLGAKTNQICDPYTGQCECKVNVIGDKCNQCAPGFWDLSSSYEGCKPCDCDPGGSLDNYCENETGKCLCRPFMMGRSCDRPEDGYYIPAPDFLRYEAEEASYSAGCSVASQVAFRSRWSLYDSVFLKCIDNGILEFVVTDIRRDMHYVPYVYYEARLANIGHNATLSINRRSGGTRRVCKDVDNYFANMHLRNNSVRAKFPSVCLESGSIYYMRLDLGNYGRIPEILIDAIVLVPRKESLPNLHGNEASKISFVQCLPEDYNPNNPMELCESYFERVGSYVFDGARPCQCDAIGSKSSLCARLGGQCQCQPNVIGRKCDKCAPGFYGLSPNGCKPCDCNMAGTMLDQSCHPKTGRCRCRPEVDGKICDRCKIGFWGFPDCMRCECNGRSNKCDTCTGACFNCQEHTDGMNCEECAEGYYGDPERRVPCRKCPCNDKGVDWCGMNPETFEPICECKRGYQGPNCTLCAPNFHPDQGYCIPNLIGGNYAYAQTIIYPTYNERRTTPYWYKFTRTRPTTNYIWTTTKAIETTTVTTTTSTTTTPTTTTSNSNEEISTFTKDNDSDEEDEYEDECISGFWMDGKTCKPCNCSSEGTDTKKGYCDKNSGKCPCLPNVTGLRCDSCEENYWKFGSQQGCQKCDCDFFGSRNRQCDLITGACSCQPGYKGQKCDEELPSKEEKSTSTTESPYWWG